MANTTEQDDGEDVPAFSDRKLPRSLVLARQRIDNPVEIDFGALLNGTPTGGDAKLQLETSASPAVEALLRPTKNERRTEQPLDDLKFNVITRGPVDFLFDKEDRLVIVSYGSSSSDHLPALTEQAMCGSPVDGPSETDGVRVVWDGRRFSEFASLSRFAGMFASAYEVRLANGRTLDRWLNMVIETPQARLFLDFLHKAVPKENDGYAIDYGLSAMTVASRRHLARCGQA
jgi:hypothetical protein